MELRHLRCFIALQQARDSVKAAANGFHGQLRVALSDGITPLRFSTFLALCPQEEPEIEIRLSEVLLAQQMYIATYFSGVRHRDRPLSADTAGVAHLRKIQQPDRLWAEPRAGGVEPRHPARHVIANAGQSGRRRPVWDLTRKLLQEKLTAYNHQEVQAPFPRIVSEIKEGHHWCYNGPIKTTERENYAYLSLPTSIFMPLNVIVRKDNKIGLHGAQSLEALLKNHNLTTSMMRDRVYSPVVDKLLKTWPPRNDYAEQTDAMNMLLAGRLDFLIQLPLLALYQARAMGHADELIALPIKEDGEMELNRVMCPKNEWGRNVIAQINDVLSRERTKPYYRAIVEKWHDPASVDQIRMIYASSFLKTP